MIKEKLRIIVTGMAGLYPVGGVAWDYLQYMIGFARMGHDVYYYEDTWSWPYNPVEQRNTDQGTYSADFINAFFSRHAPKLKNRWYYYHLHEKSYGLTKSNFDKIARTADLFLNVSGACMFPENLSSKCVKVFLDTDPGYNQIMLSERLPWSENVERWCKSVEDHDQHFTYAENIYNKDCVVPRLTFDWKTTRMPVILDLWEDSQQDQGIKNGAWSTIMTWNAFKGKLIYQGNEYKSKGSEFEKFLTLPKQQHINFNIAVGGKNAPLEKLEQHGWHIVDGPSATSTPEKYKEFIKHSRGEFSVAKHVYVAMKTGWFSCRSVCYLASSRPVVTQDTGYSRHFPCGRGLFAVNNVDEAVAAIEEINSNYEQHCKWAREIAEEYFDYREILPKLIDIAMNPVLR